jgi:hypothetical protein
VDEFGDTITEGFNLYGINYQWKFARKGVEEICQYTAKVWEDDPEITYEACIEAQRNEKFQLIKQTEKWNNAWLSNKDCSGDEKLDRHYGFDSYLGSRAGQMVNIRYSYNNAENVQCKANIFWVIYAAPSNAHLDQDTGNWYVRNKEFGLGEYEVVPTFHGLAVVYRTVYDPCGEFPSEDYISPYLKNKVNRWRID